MLTRRRAALLLALLAAVLAAGVWMSGPEPAEASHGAAPSGAHYWAPGSSTTTWLWPNHLHRARRRRGGSAHALSAAAAGQVVEPVFAHVSLLEDHLPAVGPELGAAGFSV